MPYTPAGKNIMLDALAPDEYSLHTSEPNSSGSNEVSGGSYARKAAEWNAASEGTKDNKGTNPVFSVPAGKTIKFVGFWKSGTFVGFDDVTEEVFGGAGTYTLEDADLDLAK